MTTTTTTITMVWRQYQQPKTITTTTTTATATTSSSSSTLDRYSREDTANETMQVDDDHNDHEDDETNTDTEEEEDDKGDGDDDDDDDDEEHSSLIAEVLDGWKQHCLAILVAVVATAVAVSYQHYQPQPLLQPPHHPHHSYYASSSSLGMLPESIASSWTWFSPTSTLSLLGSLVGRRDVHTCHPRPLREKLKQQHAYLKDYARTANLSFCGETMPLVPLSSLGNPTYHTSPASSTTWTTTAELLPMEFNVPKSLLLALKTHYLVDWFALQQQQEQQQQDHHDSNNEEEEARRLSMAWNQLQQPPDPDHHNDDLWSLTDSDVSTMATTLRTQFQCLLALERESPKSYIKGLTYYYPSPTIASMYLPPKHEQQQQQESSSSSILQAAASALPPVSVSSSSSSSSPRLQPAVLTFTGFAVKFVNLSPRPVLLYWEGKRQEDQRLLGEIPPMESLGTATSTPGHSFFVTPVYDSSHALQRWVVTADDCVLYYEPEHMLETLLQQQEKQPDKNQQTTKLLALYTMQKLNQEFARHYLIASGRTWLANFPRPFPLHFMHPAPYIGHVQRLSWPQHYDDDDTHEKRNTTVNNQDRPHDTSPDATVSSARLLTTTTTTNNSSTATATATTPTYRRMIVESVSPRVFSIPNFLSKDECEQLIQLALSQGMNQSTVFAGGSGGYYNDNHHADSDSKPNNFQHDSATRSSSNTWLPRHAANLTNIIYRRAAHLLHLDETLLQGDWIHDDLQAPYHSIAESLQIVRYRPGERYAPHHDFVYPPPQSRWQPTRFATLLLYLNDNFQGGQTVFPRAVNAHYHEGITMQPQQGMAVLFYNVLPDGNVDDLSQHQSEPVTEGIKYLANLWIWEPVIN